MSQEQRPDPIEILDAIIPDYESLQEVQFTKTPEKLSITGKTDTFEFNYCEETKS